MLEEADDNAGLGDPNYIPDNQLEQGERSFSTGRGLRDSLDDVDEDDEHEEVVNDRLARASEDSAKLRRNRSSVTSSSTAADYYEATDGRISAEV